VAAAQLDQRAVERLCFARLQTAESANLKILMPGEEPDAEPVICHAQLVGIEFDYPEQGSGEGADMARINGIIVLVAPPVVTLADASEIQTQCSAIAAVMRRYCGAEGTHRVDLDAVRCRVVTPETDLNGLRLMSIEFRGLAQRASGTSLET